MQVKRALVSVSDKTGLEAFVKELDRMGVEIISTGGTAKFISQAGVPVIEMSSYTGFPEMLDGRVKTLHPVIHAGLLALRDSSDHVKQMEKNQIPFIDMVVVNLYPFQETVAKEGVKLEEAIENIDIGGPSMLRSAAKNYKSVAVVSSPGQYEDVLQELRDNGCSLKEETLKSLAVEVFRKTSSYDGAIHRYLSEGDDELPDLISAGLEKVHGLRYGENPHQKAAFYRCAGGPARGIAGAVKLQGKEISFNNIMDASAAVDIVRGFERPAVSIVKHTNPCGAATADTIEKAYTDALDCDRMSAFGSIMAFNRPLDNGMAALILEEASFIECIIAPGYEDGAAEVFKEKKNLRVIRMDIGGESPRDFKKVIGGVLVQEADNKEISRGDLKVVTAKKPSDEELDSLLFAWKIVKFVKSNAIVLCQDTRTVGIGAGQMSRVDSVITAVRKAGDRARGAVLASDAFFPMPDSIEKAREAGISAIIQPGGSIRDDEVIAACDKFGLPMVFTGTRHFRH